MILEFETKFLAMSVSIAVSIILSEKNYCEYV